MKRIVSTLCLAASAAFAPLAHADEPVVGPPPLEDRPLVLREAGGPPEAAAAPAPSSSIALLKGLGVAGVAVIAFALFRRKRGQSERGGGYGVKVVARTSLGMRTEVCVVEVGGERLVLGVTPTTVTTLSVLGDAPAELAEVAEATRAPAPPPRASDRGRPAYDDDRDVGEEPVSALTRLLETARRRTEAAAPALRGRAPAPPPAVDDDDPPVDIVPRAPARKPAPTRRLEEQVRGLNAARPRRAS